MSSIQQNALMSWEMSWLVKKRDWIPLRCRCWKEGKLAFAYANACGAGFVLLLNNWMNCNLCKSKERSLLRDSNSARFLSAHLVKSVWERWSQYSIAGRRFRACIAWSISYIFRNSCCNPGGISRPDSYRSVPFSREKRLVWKCLLIRTFLVVLNAWRQSYWFPFVFHRIHRRW